MTALGLIGAAAYLVVLPMGHVTAFRSLSLMLAIVATIALWSAPGPRVIPVFAAFGAWFIAACLSLFTTRDLAASLHAIENDVLRSLIVFLIFYALTRRVGPAIWVVATAFCFTALSALAIGSFLTHGEWRAYYVPSLGDYATAAITVLPLLLGHLSFGPRQWSTKLLVAIAAVAILAAGYLTFSRAFWLVSICGVLLGAFLNVIRTGRFRRRSLMVLGIVCAAGLILATIAAGQRDRSLFYFEDRAPIYSAVLNKIPANLITGTGYGHETDKSWYAAALPQASVYHAHNIVLSYLDQMGLFGGFALLMIFGAPAWVFARVLQSPSPEAGAAALCGLVLLTCVFVKNNLDFFFVKQNLWLFFAHLGIYFGQVERAAVARE